MIPRGSIKKRVNMKRPRIKKSTAKREEVFEYLKKSAGEKRTSPYKEIGEAVGLGYRVLRFPLYFIWERCKEKGLPELNALAVNGKTGRPGAGCPELDGEWENVRERVFAFDWKSKSFDELCK
jgi:hypothetical protein